ncbi:Phosphatidylinositol/phosphatidylcholine transfer protein SFH2 [Raphanus sativus]|nr:Phosphatidylinositol/phosphatidylcholine transfer protein SFH2 [Raphanus sativus]
MFILIIHIQLVVQNGEGRTSRKNETEKLGEQEEICRVEEKEEFIDKKVDTNTQLYKANNNNNVPVSDVSRLLKRKWYVYGVVMALLMWIVGVMMRLNKKKMPSRLTEEANVYPDGVTVMPTQEYMAMAKKMTDLEEKYGSVDAQAREKEKVLYVALGRVDQLELELFETKKALDETMTRQHEMMAFIDKKEKKKKKKKRKFLPKGCFGGVSSASSL